MTYTKAQIQAIANHDIAIEWYGLTDKQIFCEDVLAFGLMTLRKMLSRPHPKTFSLNLLGQSFRSAQVIKQLQLKTFFMYGMQVKVKEMRKPHLPLLNILARTT